MLDVLLPCCAVSEYAVAGLFENAEWEVSGGGGGGGRGRQRYTLVV